MSRPALRVALVGLGPKGLFALERLLEHADGPVEVDAFEPHRAPGAGPVYDPHQPSWLVMNNVAGQVDLWWPGGTRVPEGERLPFVAWTGRGPGGRGAFVPRASVGAYLEDGLRTVLRHAPEDVVVRVHPVRVREVRRTATGWRVLTGGATVEADHDEVLLATGHVRVPDPLLAASWSSPARLIPAVFPVERQLAPSAVPPGATVGLRGFALTAIDAILALTEGRGGTFVPGDDPGRLRYVPPGAGVVPGDGPPAAIVPCSRTGAPILPKPAAGLYDELPGADERARAGRERILALPGHGADAVRALAAEVAAVAGATLDGVRERAADAVLVGSRLATSGPPGPAADVDAEPAATRAPHGPGSDPTPQAWLDAVLEGTDAADPGDPAAVLAHALDVALGIRPPGTTWALGHAWRALYPAIAARCAGPGLDDAGWAAFRALAVALERVAFGPAPLNVAKLLALAEHGVLDLRHVRGEVAADARGRTVVRSAHGERAVDVVVDAVLAPPGVPVRDDGPVALLLADGHARLVAGRRGLDVTEDGTCRGRDGAPTPGLAAVGRPTEDAEIGHDTLSRTLHAQTDLWARRVAARTTRRTA